MSKPFFLVMGVSGSGKSSLGTTLAKEWRARFVDADDYHSLENRQKMARGEPLSDQDRMPWLQSLAAAIKEEQELLVLACSALKEQYRTILRVESGRPMEIIFLNPPQSVLEQRLCSRKGHFFNPSLLSSQLATLEPPKAEECYELSGDSPIDTLLEKITRRFPNTQRCSQ